MGTGEEPERACLREASQLPVICRKNGFQINFCFKTCFEDKISCGSSTGTEGSPWKGMHFFTSETLNLKRIFIAKNWGLIICSVSLWCLFSCLLAVPHSLPQKNIDIFLVFIVLEIILQLPLRTDGRFVSSGFTNTQFALATAGIGLHTHFFNHYCTLLLLSPKEIGSAHVMFYSLQSEWFSLRITKHHRGFVVFS